MTEKQKREVLATLVRAGRKDLARQLVHAQSKEAKRAAEEEVLPKIVANLFGRAFKEAEKELLRIQKMQWKNAGEENWVMRHRPLKVMPEEFANDVAYAAFQVMNDAMDVLKIR